MIGGVALEQDVTVFLNERLCGSRSLILSLTFVVLEQRPTARAADQDCQLVLTQTQILAIAAPGL